MHLGDDQCINSIEIISSSFQTLINQGLPGYQDEEPFAPSLLVESRKRLTDDILGDINEMIIAYNTPDEFLKPKQAELLDIYRNRKKPRVVPSRCPS